MPAKNEDLHGNVPDTSPVVLIIIDCINDFEFPDGAKLFQHALPMAANIAVLKARARAAHIPVVYVNDNFGRWRSDFRTLIAHCLDPQVRGHAIARQLLPEEDDYFVIKPKHSGFYSTTLDTLLDYLGAETLILTGVAGNICVLFTANDAYLRDFHIVVPEDCLASNVPDDNEHALKLMRSVLKAQTCPANALDLAALRRPQEIASR